MTAAARLGWCGLIGLALASGGAFGWRSPQPERVVFLAVGQGDCTLVESEGRAMLIDVGPASPRMDAGAKIVVPRLRSLGVRRLDLVLLSHPDMDHIGGLGAVLRSFPEATVEAPACFRAFPKMLDALARDGVRPDQVRWTDGEDGRFGAFDLEVRCRPWTASEDDNEGSMFVRVRDGGASMVTGGDGPADEEQDMLRRGDWRAEIVHFDHHGSRTSSCAQWLQSVAPRYGIVSCGLDNRYGHPHPEVLARAKALGIEVHRTDLEGDLEFDKVGPAFALRR